MRKFRGSVVAIVGLVLLQVGCGGGGGSHGTNQTVTGASIQGGGTGTYHSGPLPAPSGTLAATVPPSGNAINGGTITISVTSNATIVRVYVSVMGQDGYYDIPVPAGSSVADVLLTLAQSLPSMVTFVFEIVDSSGNVSAPVTTATAITTVGTGEVQVSLSFDVDNDLDLHVVDPNGFEVYYGADTSPEGGTLDLDSNAGCVAPLDGIDNENVTWPTGTAPHGTYIVRVDNWQNCQNAAVDYVVTVQRKGQAPVTVGGSFAATDGGDAGGAGSGTQVTTFTW